MEIDDPFANLGADRSAAAGDHHGLALDEVLKPPVVDFYAGAEQQVLDIDRREPQRLLAGAERRHAAGGETEPTRLHQHRLRMQLRRQCAWRQHQPADLDALRPQSNDGQFKITEEAAHRNVAQFDWS